MNCLAVVKSGNYALSLCRTLERAGYSFQVVPTPCQIAKRGCGYSIRFPEEMMEILLKHSSEHQLAIEEIYRIIPLYTRNKYERIR